jgi:hypothetical protein
MVAWLRSNWLKVVLGILCLVFGGWALLALMDLLSYLSQMGT